MIIKTYMVPHPPISVAEIGKGEEHKIRDTIDSFHKVGKEIAELKPETIIITSPHATMYRDYFNVSSGKDAYGDFSRFRARNVSFHVQYDTELVQMLNQLCRKNQFPAGTEYDREPELDHGTMVPLYFINQYYQDYKLVRIGLSGLSLAEHYRLGIMLQEVIEKLDRKVVFIGSGDLAHCQKEDGPYGFQPEGPMYDEKIMHTMGTGNFLELFQYDPELLEKAMECGHRSFVIMAGALDRQSVITETYSHEATFGVGYGIISFEPKEKDPDRNFLDQYLKETENKEKKYRDEADAYVKLAYEGVEAAVKRMKPENISAADEMFEARAGAFVSIHEFGELRGCIGTILPVQKNLVEEILRNAKSASLHDPRFQPIKEKELPYLHITVDILGDPEKIENKEALNVKKYGVICSTKDGRRGLLLPDLPGVDTIEEQVRIACQKGHIDPEYDDVILERFEVVRHGV